VRSKLAGGKREPIGEVVGVNGEAVGVAEAIATAACEEVHSKFNAVPGCEAKRDGAGELLRDKPYQGGRFECEAKCSWVDDSGGRVDVRSTNAIADCVEDSVLASRPVSVVNVEEIESSVCGGAKPFHVNTLLECSDNVERYGDVCDVYESNSVDQAVGCCEKFQDELCELSMGESVWGPVSHDRCRVMCSGVSAANCMDVDECRDGFEWCDGPEVQVLVGVKPRRAFDPGGSEWRNM
jgi:hypothetical protein